MTSLRHRMLEDLQLRGLAPRTQQCYIEAVKHLLQHYRRPPDQITDPVYSMRCQSCIRPAAVPSARGSVSTSTR